MRASLLARLAETVVKQTYCNLRKDRKTKKKRTIAQRLSAALPADWRPCDRSRELSTHSRLFLPHATSVVLARTLRGEKTSNFAPISVLDSVPDFPSIHHRAPSFIGSLISRGAFSVIKIRRNPARAHSPKHKIQAHSAAFCRFVSSFFPSCVDKRVAV